MSLKDITNISEVSNESKGVTKRKRLSNGTYKQYHYAKTRKQFEIVFDSDAEKVKFENKLENYKAKHGLVSTKALFDHIFRETESNECTPSTSYQDTCNSDVLNSAKYGNFICENIQILKLVEDVINHQRNCHHDLHAKAITHSGHVAEIVLTCHIGHTLNWESSTVLGKQYTVNHRTMLAYICSGMKQIEYERFSEFLESGILTDYFRIQAAMTFSAVISVLTRESIHYAMLDEIQASKDKGQTGISVMTDARHQCRKNSFHTDHVAIGQYTHKVINMQHIDKQQERCTQKHETIGCEQMYDDFERHGISVNVHSHDRNLSVNKVIRTKNGVKNCNERWHATKPVTMGIKKIASGAQKNKGKTWHPELSDKGSRVRNHMYYAIDNCRGDANILREIIDGCVPHFQNIHVNCPAESPCRDPLYVPDFTPVTDPVAVRLLVDFLNSLTLYKNAADYALCKDTFYVESFNNTCLVYLDKRIHYKTPSYLMRINLAVLSWNEHVDRPFTSRSNAMHVQHNRRALGKKNYMRKSYHFVSDIWSLFVRVVEGNENIPELENVEVNDNDHYEEDEDN